MWPFKKKPKPAPAAPPVAFSGPPIAPVVIAGATPPRVGSHDGRMVPLAALAQHATTLSDRLRAEAKEKGRAKGTEDDYRIARKQIEAIAALLAAATEEAR